MRGSPHRQHRRDEHDPVLQRGAVGGERRRQRDVGEVAGPAGRDEVPGGAVVVDAAVALREKRLVVPWSSVADVGVGHGELAAYEVMPIPAAAAIVGVSAGKLGGSPTASVEVPQAAATASLSVTPGCA